jgi:ATP-dependent protease ClpP protease subunit
MSKLKKHLSVGIEDDANENCNIKLNKVTKKEHHVYLTKGIKSANYYIEFLNLLEIADEDDIIIIHINSYGGNLDTTIQLITAMGKCKAQIITEISGVAYSAASIIFLAGEDYKIHTYSSMLCHYYTGCIYGKGNEIIEQALFDEKFYKSFMKTIYKNFLTTKEIDQLINGKDFWFNGQEIRKRLKNKVSKEK